MRILVIQVLAQEQVEGDILQFQQRRIDVLGRSVEIEVAVKRRLKPQPV